MPSDYSVLVESYNTIRDLKDDYIRDLEDSLLYKINQIEKFKEELKAVKENLHIAQQIIDMLSEDNGKLDRENEELNLMNAKLKALRPTFIKRRVIMQGNPDIDILMIPTSEAIKKHVKDRDAFTEIYNRAYEAVMISMEAKEAERDEWKADAERLAKSFVIEVYPHEWVCRSGCHHMGKTPDTIDHSPNCPITLHRQLVEKYKKEVMR